MGAQKKKKDRTKSGLAKLGGALVIAGGVALQIIKAINGGKNA